MAKTQTPRTLSETPRAIKAREARAAKAAKANPATEAPKVAPAVLAFRLADGARPSAGRNLFAHTMAVFRLTGLIEGEAVTRAALSATLDKTALRYHAAKFVDTPAGLKLTSEGRDFFIKRGASEEMVARYMAVLSTGAVDEQIAKNPALIIPLKESEKPAPRKAAE